MRTTLIIAIELRIFLKLFIWHSLKRHSFSKTFFFVKCFYSVSLTISVGSFLSSKHYTKKNYLSTLVFRTFLHNMSYPIFIFFFFIHTLWERYNLITHSFYIYDKHTIIMWIIWVMSVKLEIRININKWRKNLFFLHSNSNFQE